MFEFIEQHKKLVLGIAIAIVLVMTGILIFLSMTQKTPPANTNTNTTDSNEPDYPFLNEEVSQEDQYLMLLGKIVTEGYGTYSANDYRGLLDVANQSTSKFKTTVDQKVNNIPANKDITTSVEPESIKLVKNGSTSASITMDASSTEGTQKTNFKSTVVLVKQGEFWLVDNITFQ